MNTYTFDLGFENEKIEAVGEELHLENEFFKVIANKKEVAIVRSSKVIYILVNRIG